MANLAELVFFCEHAHEPHQHLNVPTTPLARFFPGALGPVNRWRWEQAKRVPESEQLDQLLGSLAEAVKAVAGFTRVSGVPDYRKDFDGQTIYEVSSGKYTVHVYPVCSRSRGQRKLY